MRPLILILLTAACAPGQTSTLVDRAGSTGFVQLEAESFRGLSAREQALAFYLTRAAIALDPVIYDQNSRFGLRQKRLLEAIVARAPRPAITEFTKLFWANRGNHNDTTAQKFLPGFTFEDLRAAAREAWQRGGLRTAAYGLPAIGSEAELDRELNELRPSLFDPAFEPMMTAKSAPGAADILQASSNNFYSGVSLADLRSFHERYPLNSRLVKSGGKLVEEVYRAGTPDGRVPPGRYALFLKKTIGYLSRARNYAEPDQQRAIDSLIRFYQTGEPADWLRFGADWVRSNPRVDFASGFIEVYRDARGAKGTAQSFVTITDEAITAAMRKLAANAQYFEDRAPWDARYKKQGVEPPLAKAVEALVETGDFLISTIGVNLPNENEIHQKYGTKSFILTGSTRALDKAAGSGLVREFAAGPEETAIEERFGREAGDLMTALHEVIGHGSGKLSPRLTREAAYYLKEYASTLEEARADLMALWSVFDPKLRELGLVRDNGVGRAMYYSAARAPLVQLRRIPTGETIEQDHQRGRQLIVAYIMDQTGAIRRIERNGKTYYEVRDFHRMREGVGRLLAELMRIKAEGDYAAVKALVDRYAVRFDPRLRDQVAARFRRLDLPVYWAGVNPELTAKWAPDGRIAKVSLEYPRDVVKQQMAYAAMYER
ncbi:MAG: peptidase M49 [Bryobacteraceae bacterium]